MADLNTHKGTISRVSLKQNDRHHHRFRTKANSVYGILNSKDTRPHGASHRDERVLGLRRLPGSLVHP